MTVTKQDDTGPLAAFLRKWRRLKATAYEPHEVLHEIPLSIIFGPERPRRLLLVVKDNLLARIIDETHCLPAHWVIVHRPGMPGQAHANELVSLARRLRLPINFVGDLTPFYLHVFLEYDRLLRAKLGRPHWAGISTSWIQLCRRLARRRGFEAAVTYEMSAVEREHFAAVKAQAPWLKETLGAEPWSLLEEGRATQLETVSGTTLYGAGFHRKLVRLLDEETFVK